MIGTRTEVTTTTVVWTLPSPCLWGDLRKLFVVIERELGPDSRWDDVVTIHAGDDALYVRYDADRVVSRPHPRGVPGE